MKISSFNCSGFKGNCDYISEVYGKCDILLLQETWLYNFEFNLFDKKNTIMPISCNISNGREYII